MIMATYETFAAVYDAVMDDSLYDKWTNFSLRHLPKTKERKKLLELACGTGIQSVRFSQAGFDVTGLDLSADMLKIAEKRATSAKQKITFIEGNMLNLSNAGKYDFVTCYSDSICYMQDEVEVGDVFKDVKFVSWSIQEKSRTTKSQSWLTKFVRKLKTISIIQEISR